MHPIERYESEVRGYCRSFPIELDTAEGSHVTDVDGNRYLDFFAGAGALNYGHNPEALRKQLLAYIERGAITHSLDFFSQAKREFLERFHEIILEPRGLDYKVQFPGPTGTNAVEAALKLARKATGRTGVIAFTDGFHGMTLGSLSVTGNAFKRAGAGVPLANTHVMPFDGYVDGDSLGFLERALEDPASGIDKPAAVILETVQAEGGVNVASMEWLQRLSQLLAKHEILLIVDDIQVGCGRTGPFFSFEPAGITPDIVCLSKSLSGYGLPLAVTLMRPELDVWAPGEHNGTFRGFNHAFVTATAALEYWRNDSLQREVEDKAAHVRERLATIAERHPQLEATVRGRGLIQGLAFTGHEVAGRIAQNAFRRGLIIETAGPDDEVLKLLPALTMTREELDAGLDIIENAAADTMAEICRREARKIA